MRQAACRCGWKQRHNSNEVHSVTTHETYQTLSHFLSRNDDASELTIEPMFDSIESLPLTTTVDIKARAKELATEWYMANGKHAA